MKKNEKIHINPARLQWCCDVMGIDISRLSSDIKIAKTTLAGATVGVRQLEEIAKYFNRSLLFFLDPGDVVEEKIYSPQFRTINNQQPIHDHKIRALIERVEKQRQIYLGLIEDLGEYSKRDWKPTFALNSSNIKIVSADVRQWLNLPDQYEFETLRQSIESKGIMVFVMNSYKGKWQIEKDSLVRGFSLYYDTLPIIVIKKQISKGAQTFTLMHELAHLLIHKKSAIDDEQNFYSYQGQEKDANEFAGNLLMPDSFLNRIDVEKLLRLEIYKCHEFLNVFKKPWCVSVEAILVRLLRERKIPQAYYDAYKAFDDEKKVEREREIERQKELGTTPIIPRKYRHREPLSTFGKPFVNTVFDAFYDKHITLSKASTYLDNLKIIDMHKLEQYV